MRFDRDERQVLAAIRRAVERPRVQRRDRRVGGGPDLIDAGERAESAERDEQRPVFCCAVGAVLGADVEDLWPAARGERLARLPGELSEWAGCPVRVLCFEGDGRDFGELRGHGRRDVSEPARGRGGWC